MFLFSLIECNVSKCEKRELEKGTKMKKSLKKDFDLNE